ncbi:isopentenyl-diphosphate delta-isomerase [Photobacterium iliopiscarium]|jgi:isopentenyl-diphosphate delta-isomerase|uniref:Isopentenyl-diphosphate Delta-isomerase n=1 Tax=Photobacterium iliopiscarium TaxID=56192 RepID=A0A0D8P5M3_9GAMM|nr:isopentenyl-diphosphate Delta-isomerase [Photobacterium iliopiscarium]KJG14176.1 isopentenyl-diphosphate delta-isomerase [Photobacterium iliopiscarium]KJG24086.1 isopentenyl-diphosphate delta-isomerase [Photobacterium iliopiscarium]PST93411.1 isopentenyl-diphosphate Delta-isomerase [Photobacterium iliopiscarium]PST98897.1 isopentenyl-diphosphate Delta-isomerase [Photobacterium iliopiscarium]PSV81349.1 isopentenyl-diphosphate Delta-isomerase [Photobacterium iliopiscarium]
MTEEYVVLVDEQGHELGLQEKMQAHRDGTLHLAFSVLLYRDTPSGREYLLHQRALEKYHSGGLWTNTCCSHPRQGESFSQAGIRRLQEEMGITLSTHLIDVGHFCYYATLDQQLIEHELDHVLIAKGDGLVFTPNAAEVMAYRWWSIAELQLQLQQAPQLFTAWFAQVLAIAEQSYS